MRVCVCVCACACVWRTLPETRAVKTITNDPNTHDFGPLRGHRRLERCAVRLLSRTLSVRFQCQGGLAGVCGVNLVVDGTRPPAHIPAHAPTQNPPTHSLTHPPTHSPSHPLTHPSHPPTHLPTLHLSTRPPVCLPPPGRRFVRAVSGRRRRQSGRTRCPPPQGHKL